MRIGTWNLAGRWDSRHLGLLTAADCDLLLLTEVSERVELLGYPRQLRLQVPRGSLPHQLDGLLCINHIAVPKDWSVRDAQRHRAVVGDTRISDHDAYAIEVSPGPPPHNRAGRATRDGDSAD